MSLLNSQYRLQTINTIWCSLKELSLKLLINHVCKATCKKRITVIFLEILSISVSYSYFRNISELCTRNLSSHMNINFIDYHDMVYKGVMIYLYKMYHGVYINRFMSYKSALKNLFIIF